MKVKKAVIPAAGLGTRFLPATKAQPKEMLPIVDKPTIQYIVEEVVASGIEDIIIVTGRTKKSIEDHFDKSVELELELAKKCDESHLELVQSISKIANIHYIRQKEPRGLGNAIYCAKSFIGGEPFAILLGDDIVDAKIPCLKQMIDIYEEYGNSVLGVQPVADSEVSKYGIVDAEKITDRLFSVKSMVEKPALGEAPSNLAILGRYIVSPKIFDCISLTTPGAGNEIQLTDALKILGGIEPIYAYNFEGKRYDAGSKLGFLQATIEMALKYHGDISDEFRKYLREISK